MKFYLGFSNNPNQIGSIVGQRVIIYKYIVSYVRGGAENYNKKKNNTDYIGTVRVYNIIIYILLVYCWGHRTIFASVEKLLAFIRMGSRLFFYRLNNKYVPKMGRTFGSWYGQF